MLRRYHLFVFLVAATPFILGNCAWPKPRISGATAHSHDEQVVAGVKVILLLAPNPPVAKDRAVVEIHLNDEKTGEPIQAESIDVQWTLADFPVTETLRFPSVEPGVFAEELELPKLGNYKANVSITVGSRQVFATFPVRVDGEMKSADGGGRKEAPSHNGGFGGGHSH